MNPTLDRSAEEMSPPTGDSATGVIDPPVIVPPSVVVQQSGDLARMPFAYQPPSTSTPYMLVTVDTTPPQPPAPAGAQAELPPHVRPAGLPLSVAEQESNITLRAALIVVAGVALLAAGYMVAAMVVAGMAVNQSAVRPGELITQAQSIQLGAAKSAGVFLDMAAGDIGVTGGAGTLMEGTTAYNISQWKPIVNYSVAGSTGTLSVRQPKTTFTVSGNTRNLWDLHLASDVPASLVVSLGAGDVDLLLGGMALTKLEVDNRAGNTTIDLTGKWNNNLDAKIVSAAGTVILRLPSDVGVQVTTRPGVGQVFANGLAANGNVYTNDAYGKSPVTLNIDTNVEVGQLVLNTK
jgi:hypothetical protein